VTARAKTSANDWATRQAIATARALHVAEHGPACELCRNVPKRGLDWDHDHRTGKHRGWLCARCNRFLHGWMTPEWLRAAADYLETRS